VGFREKRLFGFTALAALLFSVLLGAARADDLLAKHKIFMGWQFSDPQMHFVQFTQIVTGADGKPKQIWHSKHTGALYRTDVHDLKAGTDSSNGFTGSLFWYSDENGFTVPVIGHVAKVNLAEDLFFSDGLAELPWTNLRTERKWDKSYIVATVKQQNAMTVDLYIDPDIGAYGGAVIDPKGDDEETIRVLDYQSAGPRHFIQRWQYDGSKSTVPLATSRLANRSRVTTCTRRHNSLTGTSKARRPFPSALPKIASLSRPE